MKRWIRTFIGMVFVGFAASAGAAEKAKYPPPRFPSYVKPPRSIQEVMPFARAAVRQAGGMARMGLATSGMTVLLVTEASADDMMIEALKRAYEERGVKVQVVPEYKLVGVSQEDAFQSQKATRWWTAEHGYAEAKRWIEQAFADQEVAKRWLRERRPDLYEAMYPKREVSERLKKVAEEMKRVPEALRKYLDEHPEVGAVWWRRGGASRFLKHWGRLIFDNRWQLMSKDPSFPADVLKLVEERTIEPLAWIERASVTDPEGTNFTFDVTEKEAAAWARGAYQQGHLYMFPLQATGRFPYSIVDYPALKKEWLPPVLTKVTGVIAGTNNHTGTFPRIEVHLENGYVKEVKGGGLYGELWREFLKYPKINDLKYPYVEEPGFWWIYEAGLGTNPKAFKRPDENLNLLGGELANSTERLTAGTLHWGFGLRIAHDPKEPKQPTEFLEFANVNHLPNDHWWHIHNLLPTYKVRVRGTKNTWITLIEKGEITALKSPEIRALASRYGDPREVLSEDWAPHLPGINAPGRYEDYAKDPWKTVLTVIKKIEAGTYEYFYPAVKAKK